MVVWCRSLLSVAASARNLTPVYPTAFRIKAAIVPAAIASHSSEAWLSGLLTQMGTAKSSCPHRPMPTR